MIEIIGVLPLREKLLLLLALTLITGFYLGTHWSALYFLGLLEKQNKKTRLCSSTETTSRFTG
jgi:hypothetical protein